MYRYDTFKDESRFDRLRGAEDNMWYPEETLWQYAAAEADCIHRVATRVQELLKEESRTATRRSVFAA
jgi:hypothetical protein